MARRVVKVANYEAPAVCTQSLAPAALEQAGHTTVRGWLKVSGQQEDREASPGEVPTLGDPGPREQMKELGT